MKRVFEPGFVYPCDHTGEYNDAEGEVIAVQPSFDSTKVTVRTEYGDFYGWEEHHPPKVGYWAKIRIYRIGGGFYPDHVIRGWSINAPNKQGTGGADVGGAGVGSREQVPGLQGRGLLGRALRRGLAELQVRLPNVWKSIQRLRGYVCRTDL